MVIIQASHVGYDSKTETFGRYCRLQTSDTNHTTTCGKIGDVIKWYQGEYQFAQNNIFLGRKGDMRTITIDNQLLDGQRMEGLFLDLDRMILMKNGQPELVQSLSTSGIYVISEEFCKLLPDNIWSARQPINIGKHLGPEMFVFRRPISATVEGLNHLENNLINFMPWIVTSQAPLLVAAQFNTQVEFDRTFRTIVKTQEYWDKKLIFISCLNIDISPQKGQVFPLTKCVPWAAYIQTGDGSSHTLEQSEIVEQLMQQSIENTEQIDMEAAIGRMIDACEIRITV